MAIYLILCDIEKLNAERNALVEANKDVIEALHAAADRVSDMCNSGNIYCDEYYKAIDIFALAEENHGKIFDEIDRKIKLKHENLDDAYKKL
jgi:hypothetical protein